MTTRNSQSSVVVGSSILSDLAEEFRGTYTCPAGYWSGWMNYWMLTISKHNYDVTRENGFQVQGFTEAQRRKVERMQPGDHILYYVREPRTFAAIGTITSTFFRDSTPLWEAHRSQEFFQHRVNIRADSALDDGQALDATQIAPRMDYVRKWVPEDWPLAFVGELHLIPRRDYELLSEEMRKILDPTGQPLTRGPQPRQWKRRGA